MDTIAGSPLETLFRGKLPDKMVEGKPGPGTVIEVQIDERGNLWLRLDTLLVELKKVEV